MALTGSSLQTQLRYVAPRLVLKDVLKGNGEMNAKVTYRQQVSFCGKPRCRKCREGIGHGPYWYAYQVIDGHTVRTYIGKHLPADAQAAAESSSLDLTPLELADFHIARGALAS